VFLPPFLGEGGFKIAKSDFKDGRGKKPDRSEIKNK